MPISIGNVVAGQIYIESGHYGTGEPSRAFDGLTNTSWMSNANGDCYIGVKFNIPYIIHKVRIFHGGGGNGAQSGKPKSFYISYSKDGITWVDLDKFIVNSTSLTWQDFDLSSPIIKARYWRLHFTEGVYNSYNNLFLNEIELYAYKPNKYLIIQNTLYYSIKDKALTLLGTPADDVQKEQWFNDYGVDDLKDVLLTPDENGKKLIDSLDDKFEVRMI